MTSRQLVLALAAVFLAFAGGVVLGARMLSAPMSTGLRADNGPLQQQVSTLTDEKSALSEKLRAAEEFDTRMSGRIVRDALTGKSVVLFGTPDAVDADIKATARLVQQAGGTVTGTVMLSKQFVGGNSADKLRSVVVSPVVPAGATLSTTLTDAGAQAGDLLGITLLKSRDPAAVPVGDAARDTVLSALRDTGFLTYPENIGAADTAVVVTGGALSADAGVRGATVARFAAALAPHGSGTVLAGRDGSADGVAAVAVARADQALADAVTTVDDINTEAGRITAVLALQDLLGASRTPPR